jgi:hypothetical protein
VKTEFNHFFLNGKNLFECKIRFSFTDCALITRGHVWYYCRELVHLLSFISKLSTCICEIFLTYVEINKDLLNKNKQRPCVWLSNKGVVTTAMTCVGSNSRAGRGVGTLYRGKGKVWACSNWRPGGRLTRRGAFYMSGLGSLLGFLWLVLSWGGGNEKDREVTVIAKCWPLWADCCRVRHLASGLVAMEIVGQNSIVICYLAIVHLYIQSFKMLCLSAVMERDFTSEPHKFCGVGYYKTTNSHV